MKAAGQRLLTDQTLSSRPRAGEDLSGFRRCVRNGRTWTLSYRPLRMHSCVQQPYIHIQGRSARKQLQLAHHLGRLILPPASSRRQFSGVSWQDPPACTQTQRMRAWSAARPCMRGESAPCRLVQPWRCPCAGAVLQQAVHCLLDALGAAASAPVCGLRSSWWHTRSPRCYCWLQRPPCSGLVRRHWDAVGC